MFRTSKQGTPPLPPPRVTPICRLFRRHKKTTKIPIIELDMWKWLTITKCPNRLVANTLPNPSLVTPSSRFNAPVPVVSILAPFLKKRTLLWVVTSSENDYDKLIEFYGHTQLYSKVSSIHIKWTWCRAILNHITTKLYYICILC